MPCSHPTTTSPMTRWIPKGLLQAQGYFQGEKMSGYHGNLVIRSQHLPRNRSPDSARRREHSAKEEPINDGYQYHYWRAKVFTKATIKYGYPSERRRLLQTKTIKKRNSHGHQKGQRRYGYGRTEMLKIDHARTTNKRTTQESRTTRTCS